ncbi:MAG: hypothetical protein WA252_21125 [Candidatus Sulfotelmatobacter sp.]
MPYRLRTRSNGDNPTNLMMGKTVHQNNPNWYSLFRAAILESQLEKVLPQIDRARDAISVRMSELQSVPASNHRETTDMSDALRYLAILSQHVGRDTGKILWE